MILYFEATDTVSQAVTSYNAMNDFYYRCMSYICLTFDCKWKTEQPRLAMEGILLDQLPAIKIRKFASAHVKPIKSKFENVHQKFLNLAGGCKIKDSQNLRLYFQVNTCSWL